VDIIPGAEWRKRFENVVAKASAVIVASPGKIELGSISYDYANLMLDGLARVRAGELGTELVAVAVWDGQPGDAPGGTAPMVKRWHELGLETKIIDLSELLKRFCPQLVNGAVDARTTSEILPYVPDQTTRVMSLLFADALGYSRLTDVEVPRFLKSFLGDIAMLIRKFPDAIVERNRWGDGLYLVFESVRSAGLFALDLCEWVNATDWSSRGLPRELSLRIALHAGPVFSLTDPVTDLPTFTGSHVTRCARIEPITPPGQVYASQGFAALAAGQRVTEFTCQFIKQAEWAKSYGTFPTYLVRRSNSPS
jgi:class 3 adenylate cyclase